MSTAASPQGLRPFPTAPDPRRYFPGAAAEETRRRLVRAIERGEGPALVIGAAGCGKSLLLEVLARQFAKSRLIVCLNGAQLRTRRALLQSILFELGEAYRGLDEGELRLALIQRLRCADAVRRVLVLVDEADALPIRLLEELRLLTGVVSEGQPLVQVVLAGRPSLEERFADPQLDAFSQRLAVRAYLGPLGREETLRYVRSQVAAVGWHPDAWFSESCLAAIHQATDGVPRLINQLADQLIVGAEEKTGLPFGADDVRRCWADLQQLPHLWSSTPWKCGDVASPGVAGAGADVVESSFAVVEFLDLDDAPSLEPTTARGAGLLSARGAASTNVEEDLPASIPFGAPAAKTSNDDGPSPQTQRETEDPFSEPFEEEEVVIDPYIGFETTLLSQAPRVVNTADRDFAQALPRTDEVAGDRRVASALRPVSAEAFARVGASLRIDDPLHEAGPGEILIVDEDDQRVPSVVPSRQFRRLFSALESGTPLTVRQ